MPCHPHINESTSFPWKDAAQILIALAALTVSITTLWLNRKITFKKTVKDKQFAVVLELIELLGSTEINFWYQHKREGGISGMGIYHLIAENFRERYKEFFNSKNMFFQGDSYDAFKFMRVMGNPFLPKEIYEAMNAFYYKKPKMHSFEEVRDTHDYVAVVTTEKKLDERTYWSSQTDSHGSFVAFHGVVVNLFVTINKWLEKHEAGDIKFQIDSKK